jgi:hypothetical protein
MILLIFNYGSAIASQNILTKSTFLQSTTAAKHIDARATVLAKGQNQLPKQADFKKEC